MLLAKALSGLLVQGNYVRDDARKYPSKTSMAGGFAGGERGVRKFAEEGDLSFDDEFRPQVSSLQTYTIVASRRKLRHT